MTYTMRPDPQDHYLVQIYRDEEPIGRLLYPSVAESVIYWLESLSQEGIYLSRIHKTPEAVWEEEDGLV